MNITYVSKEDWKAMSSDAHLAVFKEKYNPQTERIDFALLCADAHNTLILYCTFVELDAESVYMQWGGSFPPYRGSPKSFEAFTEFLAYLTKQYKHVFFHVKNDNYAMLKFAMKHEFKIIGLSHGKDGNILLEHHLELGHV